jgi:hypothetical protein
MLVRQVVFVSLRTMPNGSHASLSDIFGEDATPRIFINGRPAREIVARIHHRGRITIRKRTRSYCANANTVSFYNPTPVSRPTWGTRTVSGRSWARRKPAAPGRRKRSLSHLYQRSIRDSAYRLAFVYDDTCPTQQVGAHQACSTPLPVFELVVARQAGKLRVQTVGDGKIGTSQVIANGETVQVRLTTR